MTHPHFNKMTKAQLLDELHQAREAIKTLHRRVQAAEAPHIANAAYHARKEMYNLVRGTLNRYHLQADTARRKQYELQHLLDVVSRRASVSKFLGSWAGFTCALVTGVVLGRVFVLLSATWAGWTLQ